MSINILNAGGGGVTDSISLAVTISGISGSSLGTIYGSNQMYRKIVNIPEIDPEKSWVKYHGQLGQAAYYYGVSMMAAEIISPTQVAIIHNQSSGGAAFFEICSNKNIKRKTKGFRLIANGSNTNQSVESYDHEKTELVFSVAQANGSAFTADYHVRARKYGSAVQSHRAMTSTADNRSALLFWELLEY